jgi:hypothetical protein
MNPRKRIAPLGSIDTHLQKARNSGVFTIQDDEKARALRFLAFPYLFNLLFFGSEGEPIVNPSDRSAVSTNPFCARRIRPGAVPFLFPAGQDARQLVERLQHNAWWGQIIGHHGSGKSTLLAALVPEIERAGKPVLVIGLHDGARRMPGDFRLEVERAHAAIVAVDGYEQLSRWNRFRLKRFCHRCRLGLLVTAHAPVGLPDLFRTTVDAETAWNVVAQLQRDHAALVVPEDVAVRLADCDGDLRETLFDLYDLYAERGRES